MINDPHLKEITRLDLELDTAHREITRLNEQLGEVLRENRGLRSQLLRWEALGAKQDIKLREDGCVCHDEEGDSPCPVHVDYDPDQPKRVHEMPLDGVTL